MPKMKTKSGAKKRFRFTATGKVKHGVVGKRFLRQQTGMTLVSEPDTRIIKRNFFPYER
jgi:large subunit ribosomal protein L35